MSRLNKVSVCVPAYNGARYIGEAIESVLVQSFTDFELLIVDDCSTDSTASIVEAFCDSRLTYIKSPVRLGLTGAWNRCIGLAKGEYVYIFHQDDVMRTENLAKKTEVMETNPHVGLTYSMVDVIDGEGRANDSNRYWLDNNPKTDFVLPPPKFFETLIAGENPICCPAVMVRRECYENLGGFDAKLPFTGDWEMWMRIALHYGVAYLVEPLIKYRWHETNETTKFQGRVSGVEQVYRAKMTALGFAAELVPNARRLKTYLRHESSARALEAAYSCYYTQQYSAARQLLTFASKIHPAVLLNNRALKLLATLVLKAD